MRATKLNAIMVDECCGRCKHWQWIRSKVVGGDDEDRCKCGRTPRRTSWGYDCEYCENENENE